MLLQNIKTWMVWYFVIAFLFLSNIRLSFCDTKKYTTIAEKVLKIW